MSANDRVTALIRTWTPVWVGALITMGLTQFPAIGNFLDATSAGWREALSLAGTAVVISLWYAATQQVERRWPAVGKYLTGSAKLPQYSPSEPAPEVVDIV